MAHDSDDDPNLKGLYKYFNNQTKRGRANVSNKYVHYCS